MGALYALAQFVPSLLRWAGHENGAAVAEQAVQAAKTLTGKDTIEEQTEALKGNPELALQYQKTMNDVVVAQYEAETKQLAEVNATMRAEAGSSDKYTSRWRPTMGYCLTFTWTLLMLALIKVIVMDTGEAPNIINAVAGLSLMWSVALSVLGIAIAKRSQDKQVAAGFSPIGLIEQIAKGIGRK
jgi:hypothetical protein